MTDVRINRALRDHLEGATVTSVEYQKPSEGWIHLSTGDVIAFSPSDVEVHTDD